MSPRTETIELISAYYAAFNAHDWDGMLARVAENIRHDVNESASRNTREKFAEFMAHMDHCYDETLTDITVFANDAGDRASAEFIVNGIYKATDGDLPAAHGQSYRLPAGAFFEVKDGVISRVTTYYNLKSWIAQVSA